MNLQELSLQELDILYKHTHSLTKEYVKQSNENNEDPDLLHLSFMFDKVEGAVMEEITKRIIAVFDKVKDREDYTPYIDNDLLEKLDKKYAIPVREDANQ
jgi:hypothetical protein